MTDPRQHISVSGQAGDLYQIGSVQQLTLHIQRITAGVERTLSRFDGHVKSFLEHYVGSVERPVPFAGRARDLNALDAWLHDPAAEPYALLCARAGIGKSALLAQWVVGLANAAPDQSADKIAVVYFPISVRYGTNLEGAVFSSLCARLAYLHHEPSPELMNPQQYRGVLLDYLRKKPADYDRLVLVLDGLDEAAGWQPGADLVPEDPPAHLRILLSTRPFAGDRGPQDWLRRLGWNRPDISHLVPLSGLTVDGIREVLAQLGPPFDTLSGRADFLDTLEDLTSGDPLLLRLYAESFAQAIREGVEVDAARLKTIEPGLQGFFDSWFDDQQKLWGSDRPVRERAVRALLNTCATALGPLRRADVLRICPDVFGESWLVDAAVEPLRRFIIGDGRQQGYAFSHPRLAEYFAERLLERHEADAWRQRFVDYGNAVLRDLESGTLAPDDTPPYVVRYHAAHLKAAGATAMTYAPMLSEAWSRAWNAVDGVPTGFLADVEHVWTAAERELPATLGLAVRAATFHVSQVSIGTKIPEDLFIACVRDGVMGIRLAIATARLHSNSYRGRLLTQLVSFAPEHERAALVREAWDALLHADPEAYSWAQGHRTRDLLQLVPLVSTDDRTTLLTHCEQAAAATGSDISRAKALAMVAVYLPQAQAESVLESALAAARRALDESSRVEALCAVATASPEPARAQLLEEAIAVIPEISRDHLQKRAWTEVIAAASEQARMAHFEQARPTLLNGQSEPEAASALSRIALAAPQHRQREIAALAYHVTNESWWRTEAVERCGGLFDAELVREAREWALQVEGRESRLLASLAVCRWYGTEDRAHLLREAVQGFYAHSHESAVVRFVLKSALLMDDEAERRETLRSALAKTRVIGDTFSVVDLLTAGAMHVPESFGDVAVEHARQYGADRLLETAACLARPAQMVEAEGVLRRDLTDPTVLGRALVGAAESATVEEDRDRLALSTLAAIAPIRDQSVPWNSNHEFEVTYALTRVAKLSPRLARRALAFIRAGKNPYRLKGEIAVLAHVPARQRRQAIASVLEAATALASDTAIERLVEIARMVDDDEQRSRILHLALARCEKLSDKDTKSRTIRLIQNLLFFPGGAEFADLAARAPDDVRPQLTRLRHRASVDLALQLLALAARMPFDDFQVQIVWTAFAAAADQGPVFGFTFHRSWQQYGGALMRGFPHAAHGALLGLAREQMSDSSLAHHLLPKLAQHWTDACRLAGVDPVRELGAFVRRAASLSRPSFLLRLTHLMPAINAIGGADAVRATCRAAVDAHSCWP